jgi:hypothetical protein
MDHALPMILQCGQSFDNGSDTGTPVGGQKGFVGYGPDGTGALHAGVTASDSHPMAYCAVPPEH